MVCHSRAPFVTLALLALVGPAAAADLPAYTPDATVPCDAVPGIYRWDLSPLFASDAAWDAARVKLLGEVPALAKYEGKLADPKALRECLDLYFRLHDRGELPHAVPEPAADDGAVGRPCRRPWCSRASAPWTR